MSKQVIDAIEAVVVAMRDGGEVPYFMYGRKVELANLLKEKDKSEEFTDKKYPLILLKLEIPENVVDGVIKTKLNLAIVDYTEKSYITSERYTNVITPVLYPLYTKFMNTLGEIGLFTWPMPLDGDNEWPPHTKVDRPFYGTFDDNKNVKSIFDDPLDAIEIIDLEVGVYLKNC